MVLLHNSCTASSAGDSYPLSETTGGKGCWGSFDPPVVKFQGHKNHIKVLGESLNVKVNFKCRFHSVSDRMLLVLLCGDL